jgi:hypothetical protein
MDLPAQPPTAAEVLERAVAYHDLGGNWATFDASFVLGQPEDGDTITIDLPGQYFSVSGPWGYYVADGGTCRYDHEKEEDSARGIDLSSDSCATVRLKRDYHTYLNGLPMKLQDPGTPLRDQVIEAVFDGNTYLRLSVDYPKEGGKVETWEFFFDSETYALSGYQFFHSDKPEGGEYLLLEGEVEVGGVRMIKSKSWYYRGNDRLLGTDVVRPVAAAFSN